jgi:single-stranded DNA-binding protein
MTEASVSFAGNLTDDPEVRYTEGGRCEVRMHVACRQPRYAKSESKPEWQCSFIPESITAIASASIYPICLWQ